MTPPFRREITGTDKPVYGSTSEKPSVEFPLNSHYFGIPPSAAPVRIPVSSGFLCSLGLRFSCVLGCLRLQHGFQLHLSTMEKDLTGNLPPREEADRRDPFLLSFSRPYRSGKPLHHGTMLASA
jgi:hypothetical protein